MAYLPPRDPTEVIGRRISAYIIDLLLILGVGVAIFAALKSNSYTGAPNDACQQLRDAGYSDPCVQFGSHVYTWTGGRFALAIGLTALAGLVNQVLLQGMTGASVGKMMLGLRVVNGPGQVCGIGRAFVRWLFLIVDQAFCFLVGLITMLVTHPHRRVGDMVAGTYVVSTADVGRPVTPQAGMPPPYAYAYTGAGQPGWTPPAPGTPTWGAPPPEQPAWGTQPPPAWGTQAPPPVPEQPGWGAPQQPYQQPPPPYQQQPAPPPPQYQQPAPPSPQYQQPAPPPPQYTPPPPQPPPPSAPPPEWRPPPPATPPPTPAEPAPPPAAPSSWGTPPPPSQAPAAPESAPPSAPEQPERGGESWWDKALGDESKPEEE